MSSHSAPQQRAGQLLQHLLPAETAAAINATPSRKMSRFENVELAPVDPILGITTAFKVCLSLHLSPCSCSVCVGGSFASEGQSGSGCLQNRRGPALHPGGGAEGCAVTFHVGLMRSAQVKKDLMNAKIDHEYVLGELPRVRC
jgi:hypothetical protein